MKNARSCKLVHLLVCWLILATTGPSRRNTAPYMPTWTCLSGLASARSLSLSLSLSLHLYISIYYLLWTLFNRVVIVWHADIRTRQQEHPCEHASHPEQVSLSLSLYLSIALFIYLFIYLSISIFLSLFHFFFSSFIEFTLTCRIAEVWPHSELGVLTEAEEKVVAWPYTRYLWSVI